MPLFRLLRRCFPSATFAVTLALPVIARAGEFNQPFGPPGWTVGEKRTLIVRVDFPDSPNPVISDAAVSDAMARVDRDFRAMSQGRCWFTTTVLPAVLRLTRTKASYQTEGQVHHDLAIDTLAAARAYDRANGATGRYDPDTYDRWILMCDELGHGRLGETITRGTSGDKIVYLDSPRAQNEESLAALLVHELGHNHGLGHAHAWQPSGMSAIGAGTSIEYGDPFDVMGGDLTVTRHFNMIVKRAIGFVDVNAVQLVADSGTYRIFRHDHAQADGVRAVRFRTADSEFWLEYRCDTTGFSDAIAKRTRESVQIRWARWPDALNESDRGSYLIDATPGSDSGFSDAGVALGESITLGGVVISPLTIGGSLPREYIDVRIEVPALIAVQPSSREVAPGGSATFEVTASNANSTYQWFQYGEPIAGATSPRLAIADARSNDAAAYFVVVTSGSASVASRDAILRVGGYHGPILVWQPSYFPVPSTTNAWASLTAIARGDPRGARQWWHDGIARVGAYDIGAGFPLDHNSIGLHYATNTNAHGTITSRPAIVGIMNSARIEGAGREFQGDIRHPNGNIYDQMLLTGAGMSVQADPGQIVRISYVDLTNDIVQVEFSGAGTLNLRLDEATGPAPAENYRQPEVNYMRGHGAVIITGADENTHLSIFSVGSATAVNPALFREGVTYDGFADLAYVAIHSRTNRFGGLRVANTNFWHTRGFTGVYAPDIEFAGPVWVGDIHAHDAATPVLILGSSQDVRITGGDLLQPNGRPVQVDGMAQLQFTDGTTSHGKLMPAQTSRARLERDEIDVTTQMTQ